jgi:hypothetical protein
MAMTSVSPRLRGPSWGRFFAVLAVTLAMAAGLLRLADSVPPWLRGEPRTVRDYRDLDALERDLRTRLLLPAFFPDTLEWPPARIAVSAGDGRPTTVSFRDRATGRIRLVVGQAVGGDHRIPARLLAPGRPLAVSHAEIAGSSATVTAARGADGTEWTEVTWVVQDRRVVMRLYSAAGDPRDAPAERAVLMRLARSLHRGRP